MAQETTIPLEALEGLDLEGGDQIIGEVLDSGRVRLSVVPRRGQQDEDQMSVDEFSERWAGKLDKLRNCNAGGDHRLQHLVEKHVK